MNLDLTDEQGARQIVREKVFSKNWWLILWVHGVAGEFVSEIERLHYSGAKNEGFELMMVPMPPLFALVFALKKHMSVNDLLKIMNRNIDNKLTVEDLADRDLICPNVDLETLGRFSAWVGDPEGD